MEIPGITDGYAGSAPDVGAYESGQDAWVAGCNLNFDLPLESPSVGAPMSNVLPNGTFELYETADASGNKHPWEGSTSTFQLTGWTQEGSLTHYFNSAWTWYGEISGDGVYCVQMRSGSKLSQQVKGLKPNTLYAVAGYGRVASDFIAGNAAVAGWDKSGSSLGQVQPQSSIGNARTLQFAGVDFGATGADRLIVGLSGSGLSSKNEGLVVRVRLDDRENGPVAGELTCDHWTGYGGRHEWLTIPFGSVVAGAHDVFLEFDTSLLAEEQVAGKSKDPNQIGNSALYGLLFANAQAEDAVTIAARARPSSCAGRAATRAPSGTPTCAPARTARLTLR